MKGHGKSLDIKGFAKAFGDAFDARGFAKGFRSAFDLRNTGRSFAAGFRDGADLINRQFRRAIALVCATTRHEPEVLGKFRHRLRNRLLRGNAKSRNQSRANQPPV